MLRKKRERRPWKRLWHGLQLFIIFGLLLGIFTMSGALIWAALLQIPDFTLFESRKVSQSTKIYDRTGKILLYDVHKDVRRTIVPFDEISTYAKTLLWP
jgi:penicillin-binding protein 1A